MNSFSEPGQRGRDAAGRRNEFRAVLATDSGLVSLLAAARERYVRSGSWTTKGVQLTPELRVAATGLGIRNLKDRLAMKTLGAALQRTRFECSLEEAVQWAFDIIPPSRHEHSAARAARWETRQREILSIADGAECEVRDWLSKHASVLRRDWEHRDRWDAALLAVRAGTASSALTGPELVPVLANRLVSDPHALDVGRRARAYFERILLQRHRGLGLREPLRAGQRAALLAASNLASDGISSLVWAVGLVSSDRMLHEARQSGHVLGLPLVTLQAISDVSAYGGVAFAVENRSVFGALLPVLAESPGARRPTLICTSGNPSVAARVLLRRLTEQGVAIYYGGDTDERGVAIARTIEELVGKYYRPWHMDTREPGVRYQESSLRDMADDLRRFVAGEASRG